MKQETLVYRDGVLVSNETETIKRNRPHTDVLDKADSLLAHQRGTFHVMVELSDEVRNLRRKLIQAERLARTRTRERNSVREAHLSQQESIKALRERNEELKTELQILKEDIAAGAFQETAAPLIVDEDKPRAFAASPRKSKD